MLDYIVETKAIMQRVKENRIAQKLSVQEVAYRCNMERSNLSRLETGKINLTIKTLCLICNALNIKLTDVVKWWRCSLSLALNCVAISPCQWYIIDFLLCIMETAWILKTFKSDKAP